MFLKKTRNLTKKISIRLRLTLLFALIFGASMLTTGFATVAFLADSLQKEFDDALYNYAVDVTESISLSSTGDLALISPQVDRQKIYPFSLGTALIQIRHRSGRVLEQVGNFGKLDLPYKHDVQKLALGEDPSYRTITKLEGLPSREAESYRVISISVDEAIPTQLILQIAVPMSLLENQIANRKILLGLGIPIIVLIASMIAYLLSARALRPIRAMIREAHAIEVTNLSQRLPIPSTQDEVRELAVTLNQMIERLEKAFLSQERFIADASHQLLSPLTILKGELEQSQRAGTLNMGQIKSLLQEVDRLTKLVQDLLLLARVDAGLGALTLSEIELEEVVFEAIRKVERIARPRGVRILFQIQEADGIQRPRVLGDSDLLFHLVFNLLENAVKYSPDKSQILLTLEEKTLGVQHLVITDSGPGLDEDEFETIFERFRRGRPKNEQTSPGYGLGLAIARQIARTHNGTLWVENRINADGTTQGASFHFEMRNF